MNQNIASAIAGALCSWAHSSTSESKATNVAGMFDLCNGSQADTWFCSSPADLRTQFRSIVYQLVEKDLVINDTALLAVQNKSPEHAYQVLCQLLQGTPATQRFPSAFVARAMRDRESDEGDAGQGLKRPLTMGLDGVRKPALRRPALGSGHDANTVVQGGGSGGVASGSGGCGGVASGSCLSVPIWRVGCGVAPTSKAPSPCVGCGDGASVGRQPAAPAWQDIKLQFAKFRQPPQI